MDEEIFNLDLIEEFAFAAKKFTYGPNGPVICYDCDAVLEKLMEIDGMSYDEAIEHMDESVAGSKFVWLHDIDFEVDFAPDDKPHLTLVH